MENAVKIKSKSSENRIIWLDVARVLAILSISMNHAMSRSFNVHEYTLTEFWAMSTTASFCKALLWIFSRIGVPLFLMISGALLLDRDYEDKTVLNRFIRHNWWQLVRTTFIWLTIIFFFLTVVNDSYFLSWGLKSGILRYISTVLFVNQFTTGSMWYMPMIICVYLMIPIFGIAMKKIDDRYIAFLCALVVVSSMVFPNINAVLEALEYSTTLSFELSHTDLFSMYLVYIIIGHWIKEDKLQNFSSLLVLVVFLISFTGTALFQFWIYSSPSNYYVRYADVGILIAGASLFELLKRYANNIKVFRNGIIYLSSISFAIYFVHICIMNSANKMLHKATDIKGFLSVAILESVSIIGSIILISLLSKIKPFKKYLFMIK